MKQSSGTSSSNASTNNQQQPAKLLIDALEQLDLSALANVSSPIASTSPTAATLTAASYDRLNEIARTIIALNVVKDFPNKSVSCSGSLVERFTGFTGHGKKS